MQKSLLVPILLCYFTLSSCQQALREINPILTGAEQTERYINLLSGKHIAVVCNHTSVIKEKHLIDTLLSMGVKIQKIFSPEHGFRGIEDAGETINDSVDTVTGIKVISLYGDKKKPSHSDLTGISAVIFDIQDVGVRYYTYISTLHYIMEACAQSGIQVIVLDRPNPNGFYVDGPVMEKYKSFVGLHPVPLVHGMSIGEYANMINGEGWLENGIKCNLIVIQCKGYSHKDRFKLEINPSPNLRNMRAIYLYPSLGLFEGTVMSVGRGTEIPFQVIGHPDYPNKGYDFTPRSVTGAINPKYMNKKCFGLNLAKLSEDSLSQSEELNLSWIFKCYNEMNIGEKFFNNYFNNLAGNNLLKQQIIQGKSIDEIKSSWQTDITNYKEIRKKYLLYPDFE